MDTQNTQEENKQEDFIGKVKQAGNDAIQGLKIFVINPVGGKPHLSLKD